MELSIFRAGFSLLEIYGMSLQIRRWYIPVFGRADVFFSFSGVSMQKEFDWVLVGLLMDF